MATKLIVIVSMIGINLVGYDNRTAGFAQLGADVRRNYVVTVTNVGSNCVYPHAPST